MSTFGQPQTGFGTNPQSNPFLGNQPMGNASPMAFNQSASGNNFATPQGFSMGANPQSGMSQVIKIKLSLY